MKKTLLAFTFLTLLFAFSSKDKTTVDNEIIDFEPVHFTDVQETAYSEILQLESERQIIDQKIDSLSVIFHYDGDQIARANHSIRQSEKHTPAGLLSFDGNRGKQGYSKQYRIETIEANKPSQNRNNSTAKQSNYSFTASKGFTFKKSIPFDQKEAYTAAFQGYW